MSRRWHRNGKEAYEAVCARCHGATGEGQPGLYPPLANSRWLTGNPEVPIRIVTNGLAGPIKVRDQDYNGNMVAQRAAFNSDAEMAAALNYARGAWGNQAAVQISAADVTAVAPTGSQESASGLEPLLAEAEAEEASGAGEAVGAAEEAAADGQEGAPSGSE